MIPAALPQPWTLMGLPFFFFSFLNYQILGSCGYERLGHEEAHDVARKEEPTDTNIFSNPRETARRAVCWEVTTALHAGNWACAILDTQLRQDPTILENVVAEIRIRNLCGIFSE